MKRIIVGAIAALACSMSLAATDPYWTGNTLYAKLQANGVERGYAVGYILGVHDAWNHEICTPNATYGQIADVVQTYLRRNPHNRDEQADILVREAIDEAWPCYGRRRGSNL